MKKILTILALITSTWSLGQSRVGVIGGAILAGNTKQDDKLVSNGVLTNTSYKTILSYSAGFVGSIPIGNLLALRPELLFTRKGSKIHGNDNTKSWINKMSINYIELPVSLVFNAPTSIGKFYVGLGPYIAVGLNGKIVYTATGDVVELGVGSNDTRTVQVNRMDYGLNFLGGYEFKNGFFLDVRYAQGLKNVFPKDPHANKNTVLGLSVGKLFSFRKL